MSLLRKKCVTMKETFNSTPDTVLMAMRTARRLTDFELLAKLQHAGSATRLFDVLRNTLVAL
ncbi:hypothetical protein C2125_14015 [Rahnella aquatilis]|jgi:hypothetical protein|nr:hypothetical protein C2125_14015 [Rahnella aquatilis]